MNKTTTIQISWLEVAQKMEELLKKILGKKISCQTTNDDYDFWGIRFHNDIMSIEEVEKVCDYVNANSYEREEAIPLAPSEDTFIKSLGGNIANKMLSVSMDVTFKKILAVEDGLFLIDCVEKDSEMNTDIVQALRNKTSRDNRKLLDAAANEIERLRKELFSVNIISVPVSCGHLVAEIGGDPKDYPEMFVYLQRNDGAQVDLVVVGQPEPNSQDIRAGLYGDTMKDDWTQSYTWHKEALEAEVE